MIPIGALNVTNETPLVAASISDVQNMEVSSPPRNVVSNVVKTVWSRTAAPSPECVSTAGMKLVAGEEDSLLSRNRHLLARTPPHSAVMLTGTYAVSFERAYPSFQLVSSADSHIISDAGFTLLRRKARPDRWKSNRLNRDSGTAGDRAVVKAGAGFPAGQY